MTWAEFQLRLIGFNRSEVRQEYKLRRQAWISYIAPHQNPKKLVGKKEESWWPIGRKKVGVTDEHKQRFIDEYKKYLEKKAKAMA